MNQNIGVEQTMEPIPNLIVLKLFYTETFKIVFNYHQFQSLKL